MASWPSGSTAIKAPPAYWLPGTSGDSAAAIRSRVQSSRCEVRGARLGQPGIARQQLPGFQGRLQTADRDLALRDQHLGAGLVGVGGEARAERLDLSAGRFDHEGSVRPVSGATSRNTLPGDSVACRSLSMWTAVCWLT